MNSGALGFLRGFFAGAVVVVALFATVGPLRDLLPETSSADRVDQALDVIGSSYFKATNPDQLENASVEGIVTSLEKRYGDRFSHYFDPKTYERFQQSTSGQFSGVGMTVSEVKRGLRVAHVFDKTPAERAGIEEGDLIVAVNGDPIRGQSSTATVTRIKGPPGTEVGLAVVDGETGRERDLTLERARVRIPAVVGRIEQRDGESIAYVQLATFSQGAHGELRNEIEDLYNKGADALVLDLRGNGGGLLNEAVLVESIFQEQGPVVTTEGRTRPRETLNATGGALAARPMVVLVNGDTASASEIVSAALKENGLATVIGTRTFGKGTFQQVIELDAGGALDLTVGEYLTADGTSILDKGVVPDVRVNDKDPSHGDAALDAALTRLVAELRSG